MSIKKEVVKEMKNLKEIEKDLTSENALRILTIEALNNLSSQIRKGGLK